MTLVILLLALPVIFGGCGFLALTRKPRAIDTIAGHQDLINNLPRRNPDPGER